MQQRFRLQPLDYPRGLLDCLSEQRPPPPAARERWNPARISLPGRPEAGCWTGSTEPCRAGPAAGANRGGQATAAGCPVIAGQRARGSFSSLFWHRPSPSLTAGAESGRFHSPGGIIPREAQPERCYPVPVPKKRITISNLWNLWAPYGSPSSLTSIRCPVEAIGPSTGEIGSPLRLKYCAFSVPDISFSASTVTVPQNFAVPAG